MTFYNYNPVGITVSDTLWSLMEEVEWKLNGEEPELRAKPYGEKDYVSLGSDDEFRAIVNKYIETESLYVPVTIVLH